MLERIYIKNFKRIKETTISCESDYNVFIGENNVGKTTIFEAIHLWKRCYDSNIKKKNDGFYSVAKNILFKNLEMIRVIHDRDVFPLELPKNELECIIQLTFTIDDENFKLGFIVNKPTSIDDAYLQVSYCDNSEFVRFANKIATLPDHNISNVISINESRPIANMIANEPKMTVGEIRDKIAKGKGHEVLRNKILSNESKISDHIYEVIGEEFSFVSNDKNAYIEMKVNGRDILSYGSGFIQLMELFSSIEYSNSLIKILLIDEPDAHIHVKAQRNLVRRLQNLRGYQLFIISHNDRFVNETHDRNLFHIKDLDKSHNEISNINPTIRPLLIEGLTGIVNDLDEWRTAQKIILVEGETDESMLRLLLEKYELVSGNRIPLTKFYRLIGIDKLYPKLEVLTRAMNDVIPNKKWLLIRDTDCIPISKIEQQKRLFKNPIHRNVDLEIYYQDGYGIESTYMTDKSLLAKILYRHYSTISIPMIETVIENVNRKFHADVNDSTNQLYIELKQHFDRQKDERPGYESITFVDVINEISYANIQYIMTKQIAKWYYEEIHTRLCTIDTSLTVPVLTPKDIESLYISNINSLDDIYPAHLNMIDEIRQL